MARSPKALVGRAWPHHYYGAVPQLAAGDEMLARNAWYPTLRTDALRRAADSRKAIGFTLAGEPLALWLTPEGAPVALEDRCAHQYAEISGGTCRDGVLSCPYHGWTHAPDGSAKPFGARESHSRVASFKAADHLGFVWVALEEPADPLPGTGVATEMGALPLPGTAASALALVRDVVARLYPGIAVVEQGSALVFTGEGVDQIVLAAAPLTTESVQLCIASRGGRVPVGSIVARIAIAAPPR